MRLWQVFYQDDMKGRDINDTLDWCMPSFHYGLKPTRDEAWWVAQWNVCIDKKLPLPEELVDWWYRRYDELGGYKGWNKWGLGVGLRMRFPSDWNIDRGNDRWPQKKAGENSGNTQTPERSVVLTSENLPDGYVRIASNHSENPLNVSVKLEPHTSVQLTWKNLE